MKVATKELLICMYIHATYKTIYEHQQTQNKLLISTKHKIIYSIYNWKKTDFFLYFYIPKLKFLIHSFYSFDFSNSIMSSLPYSYANNTIE